MIEDFSLLAVGMALLILGGRTLVGGASQLAGALGVSELTIGLTVVAFGTSAPELAVNTLAAARGSSSIAFGNIVGSNIANTALVLGSAALLRPLAFESVIVSREIPMMMLATVATLILGLDGIRGEPQYYDRLDGLMLLLLFSVFLYYSASEVVADRRSDPLAEVAIGGVQTSAFWTAGRAALLAGGGLALLLGGAELTITHAVSIAEALEVPHSVIGLTLVALGTSLPELATSLVATWRGQNGLALGSVVGSNIFNLLFILGLTATIRPVEVPQAGGAQDLAALTLVSAVLLLLSRFSRAGIDRRAGLLLLLGYLFFIAWRLGQ